MSEPDFKGWAQRIKNSDEAALGLLFKELREPLFRYAYSLTRDQDSGYDAVQDAFVRLWNARERLDPSKSLKAYMYTIVRNLSLNVISSRSGHESLDPDVHSLASDMSVEKRLDQEQQVKMVKKLVAKLPERRREAFLLSRFQGLSHEEIAHVMDVAPRTVNNHIVSSLNFIRENLQLT